MDIGGVLLTNGWGHESLQKAARVFDFDYEEMNTLHNFTYNIFEIGSFRWTNILILLSSFVRVILPKLNLNNLCMLNQLSCKRCCHG